MKLRWLVISIMVTLVLTSRSSYAFDLSGAWAVNASACNNVFGRSDNGAAFLKGDSDSFGGGFIVRGDKIIGKIAKCSIVERKEGKGILHLMAACSTDVALANVQFAFKIDSDNKITRIFPGMEELNVDYTRCAFK